MLQPLKLDNPTRFFPFENAYLGIGKSSFMYFHITETFYDKRRNFVYNLMGQFYSLGTTVTVISVVNDN